MSTSLRLPSWLSPPQPDVAVEIAHGRVTVVQVSAGSRPSVTGYATEALPDGAVVPSLTTTNIASPRVVSEALRRALAKAAIKSPARVALIVPDTIARVALLPFEQLPSRQADLEQLIRWQVKKAVPFAVDDARLSYVPAASEAGTTTLAAVVARREVLAEYEAVTDAIGAHAGIVDIASFNVINTVIASGAAPAADWLLVCIAGDSTTLAIMRGRSLMFHRHRPLTDSEPLNALVHQTAMYHEDRLGGTRFAKVFVSGGGPGVSGGHERARQEIAERLRVEAETLDARVAAPMNDRIGAGPELLDAIAAPVGSLLRERGAA